MPKCVNTPKQIAMNITLKTATGLRHQLFSPMPATNGSATRIVIAIGGTGGMRGPALDDVATRLTEDQLIRQVLQGGGNMPAYGKNLSPAETTALVRFLETMKPAGRPAAADASRQEQAQQAAPQP